MGACLAVAPLATAGAAFPSAAELPTVRAALDHASRMDYAAAEETLARGLAANAPAQSFFMGLAALNRFLDLGDTLALRRAENAWEPLSPRGEAPARYARTAPETLKLYRGLAGMQLSYVASLRGQRVRSTTLALAARRQLEGLEAPEARAAVMLYDYYRARLLEKLPFVTEAAFDARAFDAAAEESAVLRDMFLGSLFWIHLDQGRHAAALGVMAEFLDRYPRNRMARQMRAAALYRSGRLDEAREAYESLKADYAALPRPVGTLPLGYYRSAGNLARLHHARGEARERDARMAEWKQAERAGLMPWMPPVLRSDLARL